MMTKLIQWIGEFIHDTIIWSLRQTVSFIRWGSPYFIWIIMSALGLALQLVVMSVLAMIKSTPEVAKKAGEDWSEEAVRRGWFPSLHQRFLTKVLTGLAFVAIQIGFFIDLFIVIFTVEVAYDLLIAG